MLRSALFRLAVGLSVAATFAFVAHTAQAATLSVINTNDSGAGSLRQAILDANANPDVDVITFSIPGAGVHTIAPLTQLPTITETVTIAGYTQPGSSVNTASVGTNAQIMIVLSGANTSAPSAGLRIAGTNVVVQGLAINGFKPQSGNGGNGVKMETGSVNAKVQGCFIGTNAAGTAAVPNQDSGVFDRDGTGSLIGGTNLSQRNVISGNAVNGIADLGQGATIANNLIGVAADGTTPLGNAIAGAIVNGGSSEVIGGTAANTANVIANNGADGVRVFAGSASILGNRIFANGELGIDLKSDGPTPNDRGDADTGPNGLQNSPELMLVGTVGGLARVTGTLDSRPNTTYRIEFFTSTAADSSGFGEGETFQTGYSDVTTDARGFVFFNRLIAVPSAGLFVTATATDLGAGETSEFSRSVVALNAITVTNNNDSGSGSLRQAILDANTNAGTDAILFTALAGGVLTIAPATPLPVVTDTIVIDGFTKTGAHPNTDALPGDAVWQVELDGSNAGTGTAADGISIGAAGSIVRGLVINRFASDGVDVHAANVQVTGNLFGADPALTTRLQNGSGVRVEGGSSATQIGGPNPADANIFAGSNGAGISNSVGGALIRGNLIGSFDGATTFNNIAAINSTANAGAATVIGGTGAGEGNLIAGNNVGVISSSASVPITIRGNEIRDNSQLGIELGTPGVTPNDPDDTDVIPQNFPVLSLAQASDGSTNLAGTLDTPAGSGTATYSLDFYANQSCDSSGFGEGDFYLGGVTTSLALGGPAASFSVSVPNIPPAGAAQITATATDAAGFTSEFSQCIGLIFTEPLFADGFE